MLLPRFASIRQVPALRFSGRGLLPFVVSAAVVAAGVGCTRDGDRGRDERAAPRPPAACDEQRARQVTEAAVTSRGFAVTCAKAAAGTQFFFVNQDASAHTVTTGDGAPQPFDAELPQEGSTFAPTLAAGTYEISCRLHGEEMTLVVV